MCSLHLIHPSAWRVSCYLYDNVYMKALNARIISFNIAFINTVQLRNMSAN